MTQELTNCRLTKASLLLLGFLFSLFLIYLINRRLINCIMSSSARDYCQYSHQFLSIAFISISFTLLWLFLNIVGSLFFNPKKLAILVGIIMASYILAVDREALVPLWASGNNIFHDLRNVREYYCITHFFLPAGVIYNFTISFFFCTYLTNSSHKAKYMLPAMVFLVGLQYASSTSIGLISDIHFEFLSNSILQGLLRFFPLMFNIILFLLAFIYLFYHVYNGSFILNFLFILGSVAFSQRLHWHFMYYINKPPSASAWWTVFPESIYLTGIMIFVGLVVVSRLRNGAWWVKII